VIRDIACASAWSFLWLSKVLTITHLTLRDWAPSLTRDA